MADGHKNGDADEIQTSDLFGPKPPPQRFKSRDTNEGYLFEKCLELTLATCGYGVISQVKVGKRLGVTDHIVDFVIEMGDRRVLISAKWQASGGTGEDKMTHEVDSLAQALTVDRFDKAYIVLGGHGWNKKKKVVWLAGILKSRIVGSSRVDIIDLDRFYELAMFGEF